MTSTLTVECNGNVFETQSRMLIDPDGVVYDINTNARLSGAQVMCMQKAADGTDVTYSVWPAADFGQLNPQMTKPDGYFSFFTPAGLYRLDVVKSGYQPYRSPGLQVVSTPMRHDVPLTPIHTEAAQVTIAIGENGFEPSVVKVAPGTVIAFVNADAQEHRVNGQTTTSAMNMPSANGLDSGSLGPNQRYTVKLAAAGTYRFSDEANPELVGAIVVEGPSGHRVMLPLIQR